MILEFQCIYYLRLKCFLTNKRWKFFLGSVTIGTFFLYFISSNSTEVEFSLLYYNYIYLHMLHIHTLLFQIIQLFIQTRFFFNVGTRIFFYWSWCVKDWDIDLFMAHLLLYVRSLRHFFFWGKYIIICVFNVIFVCIR